MKTFTPKSKITHDIQGRPLTAAQSKMVTKMAENLSAGAKETPVKKKTAGEK